MLEGLIPEGEYKLSLKAYESICYNANTCIQERHGEGI
jgi:hypothetical protein